MKKIILVLLTVVMVFSATAFSAFAAGDANVEAKLNEVLSVKDFDLIAVSVVSDEESYVVISGTFVNSDEKTVDWSGKYALTVEQYLSLFHVNESVLVFDKAKGSALTDDAAKVLCEAVDASVSNMDVDLNFNPADFTRNIRYMGLGMLGIFVVVGVVILITFGLNSATGKKKA